MLNLLVTALTALSFLGAQPDQVPGQTPGQGGFPGAGGGQGRRNRPGAADAPVLAPGAAPAAAAPATAAGGKNLSLLPWTKTKHTITIHGVPISYTATCGYLPVKNASGEVDASMFFVEYSKDGEDRLKRPVTFCFNGGPGSSSVWLHMGTIGPKRAKMNDDGSMPAPPFDLVDNQESWLPSTDIVMLDAIGTGYSRTTNPTDRQFYGVQGDLGGFTEAIKSFLSMEKRWRSPIFVAGESYGGIRVAGLSDSLLSAGIAVNGIISISGVMNEMTLDGGKGNDVPFISFLPSECAVAFYHKKLDKRLMANFDKTFAEVVAFDLGEYTAALSKGNSLTPAEEDHIATKLSEYLGLPKAYVLQSNLRVRSGAFQAELVKDKMEAVGRYDGRLIGKQADGNTGRADYDASDSAVTPPFTAAFNDYIGSDLNFHSDDPYRMTGYAFIGRWDYGDRGGYPDTSENLRRALDQNPSMKIMLCCGYYDLACPYGGMLFTMNHLGEAPELKKNIHFEFYPAGHMMYIDRTSREKLAKDVAAFITGAKNTQ